MNQLVIDYQICILSKPLIHQLAPLNPYEVFFLSIFISFICEQITGKTKKIIRIS